MTYTEDNRGHIQNNKRAKQVIEFIGLKYGNCTPTDIDGFIEKDNKIFVFFELKYKEEELPIGQKIALVRLVDNLQRAGKKSILYVGRHNIKNTKENVVAADVEVTDIYFNGIWHKGNGETLGERVKRVMEWVMEQEKKV